MDKELNIRNLISLLTILLFIFIENPIIKLVLVILYILIASLSGIRVKILPNVILLTTIVFINLLSPLGQIIYTLGPLNITLGALSSGIERGALLIGLLYLSKSMNMSNIKLPGSFGILIRDTFFYFSQLTTGDKIKFKSMISDIDIKLLNLKPYSEKSGNIISSKKNPYVYISFILTIIIFTIDKFILTS
ncbi:MAG: hypothetical protein OCD02_22435 [Spirochaetaceae bacterium]